MADWLTVEDVRTWLVDGDDTQDDSLQLAVDAVLAYVPDASPKTRKGIVPAVVDPPTPASYVAAGDVFLGAAMLAARWHARRASLLGTAGYTEFGTASIMRHDPDIARMLGLGAYSTTFSFGAPTVADDDE